MSHLLAPRKKPAHLLSPRASKPSLHPRRTTAEESVTLRRRSPAGDGPSSTRAKASCSGSASSSLINNRQSSGETSNAEQWFENSNQNVMNNRKLAEDNEPPFFLNQSSSESHADGSNMVPANLNPKSSINCYTSVGSSSEEYRSVIDDLTIQNNRLKKKLKRYERLHDTHLEDEKLFEVKFHGLPTDKKRELEETLRKFALSLQESPNSGGTTGSSEPMGSSGQSTALQVRGKPSSSSTRVADSGYGSMTASGQTSNHHSTGRSTEAGQSANGSLLEATRARNRNIHSFLHDIPEGLMPRQSTAMTEKARKKLVVKRLEQIFCGRGAGSEGHQQPLQQQEVSNSAARADRTALEAQGQKAAAEGFREAAIMAEETEDPMDFQMGTSGSSFPPSTEQGDSSQPTPRTERRDFASNNSPQREQRPTRPLDLDPHRAQVPADNIRYIRHLGFQLPPNSGNASPADNEGWIYLNILTNMAQLHTENVTIEFVKRAVAECSGKLELSNDGRKIRWKGKRGLSSDTSSGSYEMSHEAPLPSARTPTGIERKRERPSETGTPSNTVSGGHAAKKQLLSPPREHSFTYTPLIVRQDDAEDGEDCADDESSASSPIRGAATGVSSALANTRIGDHPSTHRKDDGPIIFYNKAKFCTDLSGDPFAMQRHQQGSQYLAYTSSEIGVHSRAPRSVASSFRQGDRPLLRSSTRASVVTDDSSSSGRLEFSDVSSPKHVTFAITPEHVDFEASGVGGVRPDDNLTINVVRQHGPAAKGTAVRKTRHHRLQNVLPERTKAKPPIAETVLSSRSTRLPPSQLPPASFAFGDDVSELDEMSDSEDEDVPAASHEDAPRLATPPPPQFMSDASSDEEEELSSSQDAGDDDDDQSVDFLATARAINPDAVRAKERQYDAEMADRLAEEIPAGSSAATAGGGSGFNSPAEAEAHLDADVEQKGQLAEGSVSS